MKSGERGVPGQGQEVELSQKTCATCNDTHILTLHLCRADREGWSLGGSEARTDIAQTPDNTQFLIACFSSHLIKNEF